MLLRKKLLVQSNSVLKALFIKNYRSAVYQDFGQRLGTVTMACFKEFAGEYQLLVNINCESVLINRSR